MRKIVGKRWGAAPAVMLRLINQVVLPKLFFGVECWSTIVKSEVLLRVLDQFLSTCARLALGLDRFTSTETALVVSNIQLARLQILRRLCRFMIRTQRQVFISMDKLEVPGTYLLPREVAIAWYRRVVIGRGLLQDPPPARNFLLFSAVDRGLCWEWNARWQSAPDATDARKAFPTVGSYTIPWTIPDRGQFTCFIRFMISDVYIGSLHLPRDDMFDLICPICGEELSRQHILVECNGLRVERGILRGVPTDKLSDFWWLVRFGMSAIGKYLILVQNRFVAAGDLGVHSQDLCTLSSTG